jgi:hypothetical protein
MEQEFSENQYWSQWTRGDPRFESLRNQRDHNSLDDYQTSEVFGSANVVIIATLQRLERGSWNRMSKLGSRLTERKANKDSV